jgi:Na+:H+ antiporter
MVSFNDVILLLVVAITIAIVCYGLRVPYSIGLVLFGVLIGAASLYVPSLGGLAGQTGLFSKDVFFGILLPPLVYEAAIHVNYSLLRSRVSLILAFAFLGVILSTVITGFLVSEFTTIPLIFALLVGAILSPTDPVAVFDLFKRVRVPAPLSTIIESESLLNDGVGIVVFLAILQVVGKGSVSVSVILGILSVSVLGGLATGVAFAAASYLPHKYVEDPNIETVFSLVMAYGSFHVAEAVGASGIISLAVTGIVMGTWVIPRTMEKQTKEALFSFWSVAAYISNSIIFLSMGLLVNLRVVFQNLPIILVVFCFVTLARASFIYFHLPLSRLPGVSKLPLTWYNTLTVAGVRGAIPVVLALTLSASALPIPEATVTTLVSVVIGVALLSTTVQSAVAGWYVNKTFRVSENRG